LGINGFNLLFFPLVIVAVNPDPSSAKRTSLEDVAAAAGVGKSTVARALKGDKHVARKTSRVILDIAQKLGYQPDPVLSTLARERWRGRESYSGVSVALIQHVDPAREDQAHAEMQGMLSIAGPRGYKVDLIDATPFAKCSRLEEILFTRNYRALIFGPMHTPAKWLKLEWERYSMVSYGTSGSHPAVDFVGLDHFGLTQLALTHLHERGYKRIGLTLQTTKHHTDSSRDHDEILAAYTLTSAHCPTPVDPVPAYQGDSLDPAPFFQWLHTHQPDALLASTPVIYDWLAQIGINVPQDIGYACLHLNPSTRDQAGIRSEHEQTGRRVMELLDHHVCTNARGLPTSPGRMLINPVWLDGPTLGVLD
jgi:LacI family transcriptional regulator